MITPRKCCYRFSKKNLRSQKHSDFLWVCQVFSTSHCENISCNFEKKREKISLKANLADKVQSLKILNAFSRIQTQEIKVFKPLITYAEKKNVKLMIENCPMVGWQEPEKIGNIFYSPQLWKEILRITPDSFGINFDPSHLYWLGIDYIKALEEFKDRVFHVHAKDVEVDDNMLDQQGIFGHFGTNLHGKSWWIYRLPGLGEIDWREFMRTLKRIGYDFVISIEHEDPVWTGTVEKSKTGLKMGLEHLRNSI